jgi:hypothetical protein
VFDIFYIWIKLPHYTDFQDKAGILCNFKHAIYRATSSCRNWHFFPRPFTIWRKAQGEIQKQPHPQVPKYPNLKVSTVLQQAHLLTYIPKHRWVSETCSQARGYADFPVCKGVLLLGKEDFIYTNHERPAHTIPSQENVVLLRQFPRCSIRGYFLGKPTKEEGSTNLEDSVQERKNSQCIQQGFTRLGQGTTLRWAILRRKWLSRIDLLYIVIT